MVVKQQTAEAVVEGAEGEEVDVEVVEGEVEAIRAKEKEDQLHLIVASEI